MGIPKYFRYLTKNYNDVTKSVENSKVKIDNLYFDMNCLIHPCVATVINKYPLDLSSYLKEEKLSLYQTDENYITPLESKIYKEIDLNLDLLIKLVNPQKSVYISVDGVAPRAKMQQQRIRRYRTIKEKMLSSIIYKKYNINKLELDTNCITPGTIFLYKLCKHIREHLSIISKKDLTITYILDDCQNMGEGEHKIFQYIKKNIHLDDVNCVYGLDADLIMLSLCSKRNIYLLREKIHFGIIEKGEYLYLDILLLKNKLVSAISDMINANIVVEENKIIVNPDSIIDDYITLCFFIGNDFLPSLVGVDIDNNSLNNILTIYVNIFKIRQQYLVEKGKINFIYIKQLLTSIYNNENEYLPSFQTSIDDRRSYLKHNNDMELELEKLKYYPKYNKTTTFKLGDNNWLDKYYNYYFDINNIQKNKSFIDTICATYIEGLQWNLEYYLNDCPSWSWYYPFRAAPCLRELCKHLLSRVYPIQFNKDILYTPFEQLAIVLPIQSSHLWSTEYKKKVELDLNLKSFYPIDFNLDTFNKYYLHECNPKLTNIDDTYIKQLYSGQLLLTDFETKRNNVSGLIIF